MLEKVCKIMSTMGSANKLIRILTVLRLTVFAGAFVYAGVMFISIIKQLRA
ncbi:MAG: hypothetical protein UHK54_03620 [Acutalibacteraceae bacterium]|nr:hypothetical protein [Acutalibacteraceae bacterium]